MLLILSDYLGFHLNAFFSYMNDLLWNSVIVNFEKFKIDYFDELIFLVLTRLRLN